jgi:hypothetical protein
MSALHLHEGISFIIHLLFGYDKTQLINLDALTAAVGSTQKITQPALGIALHSY